MTDRAPLGQSVPNGPAAPVESGIYLTDGVAGLRSLPQQSVDLLLTDPPYGTTRNFWDVPLPLPELWEAVKWAVKPDGAILFFAAGPAEKDGEYFGVLPKAPAVPAAVRAGQAL